MAKNDSDFELVNLPEECKDPAISKDDFVLTDVDSNVHEQKFQTKPTTFVKDSFKRFKKNKSSVVAAFILGILILGSIIIPIALPQDLTVANNPALNYLEPKLFDNANGFWDGTVKKTNVPVDTSSPDESEWYPDPVEYKRDGIGDDYRVTSEQFTNNSSKYGRKGYVQLGYTQGSLVDNTSYTNTYSPSDKKAAAYKFTLDLDTTHIYIDNFVVADEDMIRQAETTLGGPILPDPLLPENTVLGNIELDFVFTLNGDENRIALTPNSITHNITEANKIDVNEVINSANPATTTFDDFYFSLKVTGIDNPGDNVAVCSFVKCLTFSVNDDAPEKARAYFNGGVNEDDIAYNGISFNDATEMVVRQTTVASGVNNLGYWDSPNLKYVKGVYLSRCTYASFTYDTYKGQLGRRNTTLSKGDLDEYKAKDWIDYQIRLKRKDGVYVIDKEAFDKWCAQHDGHAIVILDPVNCPIVGDPTYDDFLATGDGKFTCNVDVTFYKYLGYDSMPRFLAGTDKSGRDMLKYVFDGLKWSLLLGVFTFVICFTFGLIWGAVCGYFGGTVDLVMERLTDILSGLPWIVLMTIVILKTGQSNFWTFALALCLTGWIGTASTTRTQFYRFRGREYVLASRTLGASDARLIAKHVLPNALGTIITSSVLIIPSVIFSEATISYLGLGFKNLSSLGVILSSNQGELTNHPYCLIFPSIIIALVMISFNLFGNGLRDAINPSLKGEGE